MTPISPATASMKRLVSLLRKFYEDSISCGYPAARVIGEMTPEIQRVSGGDRLLEYEARVACCATTL